MKLAPKEQRNMKDFNKHVSMVSYGDDNCINISSHVIEWFNQVTIAEGYGTMGMVYTDESKSGEMIPYRRISEIAYLKRGFVWDDDEKTFLAPLALESVLEIPNWIRGRMDRDIRTIENIETACFELSLHGREIFDFWTSKLRAAALEKNLDPEILTYDEYRDSEMAKYGKTFDLVAQVEVNVETTVEINIPHFRSLVGYAFFFLYWILHASLIILMVDVCVLSFIMSKHPARWVTIGIWCALFALNCYVNWIMERNPITHDWSEMVYLRGPFVAFCLYTTC
jgi:hypothetical protein